MTENGTYIIAEAGVNHNGSLKLAKELIDVAAKSGANAVKFQTFKAASLVTRTARKADYQSRNTNENGGQYEMLRSLELSEEQHQILHDYAARMNIEFLSTPFDKESLDFLVNIIGIKTIKVSSGDLTDAPFLLNIAHTALPVILSTGMATLSDIETALSVLAFGYLNDQKTKAGQSSFAEAYVCEKSRALLSEKVTLLHCTTEYPAPYDQINLRAMETMSSAFGFPVGLSDHTEGIHIAIAAVARGAKIIEKHFTTDRNLPGPDHKASLAPDELRAMVSCIRDVERSLGNGIKCPSSAELKNRQVARKSLVAAESILIGDIFTLKNLTVKRPGTGLSPILYWDQLGKQANRNYVKDEIIDAATD